MEKVVEIANFQHPEKAELLASILQAEGVECYVRNGVSSRVMRGYVDIGACVDVLESDVPLALEIMKETGYALPDNELKAEYEAGNTGLARRIPLLRNLSFEKQLIIIIGLIIGLAVLLIYLQSYFSVEAVD